MITTTHAILNTALLGKKGHPERNWPLVIGSFFPDLPSIFYFLFAASLRLGWVPASFHPTSYAFPRIWVDWGHSIPLALTGLLVCLLARYTWGSYFFAAMTLHDLEDLPLHSAIAHRHFLPFSNYVFHSPISYFEPAHYSAIVAPLEALVVLLCVIVLWRRGLKPWVQIVLIFVMVFQAATLLYALCFHWWLV